MRWWRVIWTDGLRGFARPLAFADRNVGAAAFLSAEGADGSCLLRTGDGGKTWTSAVLDGTDITSNGTSTWRNRCMAQKQRAH